MAVTLASWGILTPARSEGQEWSVSTLLHRKLTQRAQGTGPWVTAGQQGGRTQASSPGPCLHVPPRPSCGPYWAPAAAPLLGL